MYRFKEGDRFEGKFKQNQVSFGLMTYENGESYEGEFAKGEREGVGTYKLSDGKVLFEGHWKNDKFISSF